MESPPFTKSPRASATGGSSSSESWMEIRLQVNEQTLSYYAASLAALIGIFILGHWIRRLAWNSSQSNILRPIVVLSRTFRKVLLRQLPAFTSVGHAALVIAFVGLNALFSFYRVDFSKTANFASRFGWMAAGNLAFVVFLALKNTPLAFLTAYSYERLNSLHKIAGYTTLLYAILHASLYTSYFINYGYTYILRENVVTAGIVVGFAMLFTVLSGMTLQRAKYELFYIIHLSLFVVIVVALGFHRPSLDEKTLIITIVVASLWVSDRMIRIARLAYNGLNNEATVFPLPNGGTRVVIKKPITRARPGKHCYVWLPHIRSFETHPFTIVATEPMELVINTHSGFTKDLHEFATQNPGKNLKVSVEGPYGTLPDPMEYDKVILVAGGSGATFTIGIAADMIRRLSPESTKQIEFIWVSRSHHSIEWFTEHLSHLLTHECADKIGLKIHLTKVDTIQKIGEVVPIPPLSSQLFTLVESKPASISDKATPGLSTETSSVAARDEDSEKNDNLSKVESREANRSTTDSVSLPIIYGRPDIETSVREAIGSAAKNERVLVAACGPLGLVNTVRNTTASCISINGPSVELHCEQFGW
ncbi:ferric reductase NAD binding domain-containing protein [Xylaria arbuscula]|nr:ferric reductase NAD binding domain-containing protein [Xylaria arbuscula]